MTFRAKPVVKRDHRPTWEGQDRRNLFLNLGFGLIVVIAVGILVVAAGYTYYTNHLAPVGSIDGQTVTKDEYNDRLAIQNWRLNEEDSRIRTATLAGRLTQTQQLAHRLMLDLQSQIRRRDTDSIERRFAKQHTMPLENVGVLHRENVRRRFPFARRESHRRRIPIFRPRLRHRRNCAQAVQRQRVDNHQHVVVGLALFVLAGHRRSKENDRAQSGAIRELQLSD
jgi:hypothetical protein